MSKYIEEAKKVLDIESRALVDLSNSLDKNFDEAVDLILSCKGKVILTGIGKSGHIGMKIASTFASTGTPAFFLHPAESLHGDMGMISEGDMIISISYGGGSSELFAMAEFAARRGIPFVVITGNIKSKLAESANVVLSVKVKEEACPLGLAPTTSSTVTLALGDALGMTVLKERGFGKENFAEFHPGGTLGRQLLTRVNNVMHLKESMPIVKEQAELKFLLGVMTAKEVRGITGVVDDNSNLIGSVTDGDIRRQLDKNEDIYKMTAADIMTRNPKTIDQNELAQKALFLMDQLSIQSLFVVDKSSETPNEPIGILHLQDLLSLNIR